MLVDYPTLTGRVCELAATGTVVAPGDILELLTRDDTLIQRAVFDSPNTITDISRARTFRGTLRRILDLTHRRCRHDTCHTPAHLCQADHVIPWTQGGPTVTDNGRLTCGPHNRWYYNHEQRHGPPSPADDTDTHAAEPSDTDGPDRRPSGERPCPATPDRRPPSHDPLAHPPPPRRAHWVLRVAVPRRPELALVDGDRAWAIDLQPEARRTNDQWREYPRPFHPAA